MEIINLFNNRYSCRSYKSTRIEESKLETLLESARLAPTAANRQPFKLIIIKTKGKENELRSIYNREWFVQAPIVICAVGLPQVAWTRVDGKKYTSVDVAIVMDHLILTAASIGLGTCWIAAFDPISAKEFLKLPDDVEPIIFTPLGYPADTPKPKSRKPLSDLICYEKWQG
jgi:nitroreductase